MFDRTGATLTEIPELGAALAIGGSSSSGRLKKSGALFTSSAATVTTDKTDYAPAETVTITGTGWAPARRLA